MGVAGAGGYRFKQFWNAVTARVRREELAILDRYLAPPQRELFRRLDVADQRHSLDVFYTLRSRGYSDRELLQAALLHDIGKSGVKIRLWQRVALVLIRWLRPGWLEPLAWGDPYSWRYPFYVQLKHSETGAEMAARVGASPGVVALIRDHQQPRSNRRWHTMEDKLMAALQWADGIN